MSSRSSYFTTVLTVSAMHDAVSISSLNEECRSSGVHSFNCLLYRNSYIYYSTSPGLGSGRLFSSRPMLRG